MHADLITADVRVEKCIQEHNERSGTNLSMIFEIYQSVADPGFGTSGGPALVKINSCSTGRNLKYLNA